MNTFCRLLLASLCVVAIGLPNGCKKRDRLPHSDNFRALPAEARQTIRRIERGGPFPYRRDGVTFRNRERRLPIRSRGYYKEYTVKTPGLHHRGPRRIVTGKKGEFYYTSDHYRSFRRVR